MFVYNKPWINRHASTDICAASSVRILDVTQLYFKFQSQPVCLKIASKSENELLSMNFKGKCAIKLLYGLPKLELSCIVSLKVMKS